jgi:hypothetical protein
LNPRTRRKCCLIDQRDAALHCVDRSSEARFQRTSGNLDKTAVPFLQLSKACCFMLIALANNERGLRIIGGFDCSA